MEMRVSTRSCPGFRFSPAEEELVLHYLRRKIEGSKKCDVISEIDAVRHEPWDLPEKSATPSDNEWYFFSPRGMKYTKGGQIRRATQFGYWKATGKQRDVKSGARVVGSRRTLVFHKGHAPNGKRTEWIMHEYSMSGTPQESFVVCRVRNRKNIELKCNDIPPIELNQSLSGESSISTSVSNLLHTANNVDHMGMFQELTTAYQCNNPHSVDHFDSEYDKKSKGMVLRHESCSLPKVSATENSFADMLNDDIMMLDDSSFANHLGNDMLNEEFMDYKFEQPKESFPSATLATPTLQETSPPIIIIRSRKGNKPRNPLPFQGTAPRRIRMKCQYMDEPSVEASGIRDEMYQNVAESAEFPRCLLTTVLDITVNHRHVTVFVVLFLLVSVSGLFTNFVRQLH
ncbi:hypothetical protein DCAR_0415022 [Daucus carota subsp. sativus]|uniref:NAC domain-containing protein n=1 Tax=Daucus carota subsp. sativus TaxID=79200 RepID=A0AAF0WX98_DAUCS|nr:hypothetical protein DCAR_0415022 [Daucus carota subsp. sativus]